MSIINIFFPYLVLLMAVSIVGIVRFKKLTMPFRILTMLIVVTLLLEVAGYFEGMIMRNGMPVSHITAIIEYALFALIYYYLFDNFKLKKVALGSILFIVILELFNIRYNEDIYHYPSLIINISQIFYVGFAFLLFRQMLLNPIQQSIFKQNVFWFNINVLFFAATLFLYNELVAYFMKNKINFDGLAIYNWAVNMVFYLIMGYCILVDKKRVKITEIYR